MEVIVRLFFYFHWFTEHFNDFTYSDMATRVFSHLMIKIQAVYFHTLSIQIIKNVMGFLSVCLTQLKDGQTHTSSGEVKQTLTPF